MQTSVGVLLVVLAALRLFALLDDPHTSVGALGTRPCVCRLFHLHIVIFVLLFLLGHAAPLLPAGSASGGVGGSGGGWLLALLLLVDLLLVASLDLFRIEYFLSRVRHLLLEFLDERFEIVLL